MIDLEKPSPKYYARIDGEQCGPFPLDQLAEAGVRPSTYVWCAGMDDWEKAEDVPDICRMFRNRLHDLMHPKSVEAEQRLESTEPTSTASETSPSRFDPFLGNGGQLPSLEEIEARENHDVPPTPMLVPAIVVAILFCPLVGLVAIYYALKSRTAWKKGEKDKAHDYNRNAKMWTGITFFIGLIVAAFIIRRNF